MATRTDESHCSKCGERWMPVLVCGCLEVPEQTQTVIVSGEPVREIIGDSGQDYRRD